MQSASSRIWTRVAVSISNDDNHYTTGTSRDNCIWWGGSYFGYLIVVLPNCFPWPHTSVFWALSRRRKTLSIGKLSLTSDYHLFSLRKGGLRDKHYVRDEKVKTTVLKRIKERSTEFYVAEILVLIWWENIAIERNGVEKYGWDPQRTRFILMYTTCSCVSNYSCTIGKSITFWRTLVL